MIYTTATQTTGHALLAAGQQMGVEEAPLGRWVVEQPSHRDEPGPGQQLGKLLRRPAIGGRYLVVEADRLRPLGPEEGHQEQAPWCQDTHLLSEQRGQFFRWCMDDRVVGQHSTE